MPWTLDLSNLAIPFLNLNHPPANWTNNILQGCPLNAAVYFFRQTWWDTHRLKYPGKRGRNFPAFHWFAATYAKPNPRYCSKHQIVCATRLELGLIPDYALPPLPPTINAWFNDPNVPITKVAWKYSPKVKDIGTFRTLDEKNGDARSSILTFSKVERPIFDPSHPNQNLPNDVWQQIEWFFLRDPTVRPFLG